MLLSPKKKVDSIYVFSYNPRDKVPDGHPCLSLTSTLFERKLLPTKSFSVFQNLCTAVLCACVFRKVTHHVIIKRDLSAVQKNVQIQQMHHELQKVREVVHTFLCFVYKVFLGLYF